MVKREMVISRIDKIKEYLSFLQEVQRYSKEEYMKDPFIYGAAERFLHLAIECVLDIGNHIIADMRYRKPESNKDIFEVLYENKLIDLSLKENISNMAGFRNILVHDYLKLNRGMVYDIICNHLIDIEQFIDCIIEYI